MKTAAQEAVAGLLESIQTPLDGNDLGRLARMHSWGQNLIEAATCEEPVLSANAGRLAAQLVSLLERLILDEAADADAGIQVVPEAVTTLQQLHEGQSVDVDGLISRIASAAGGETAEPGSSQDQAAAAPAPSPPPPVAEQPPAPVTPEASAEPHPEPAAQAPPETPAAEPEPAAPACEEPPVPAPEKPSTVVGTADEPYVSEPLMIDMSEKEHLEGFLDEATEHMDAIEAGLLEVESDPTDTGKINELFRPFHTIKGIAGFLNLRDINRLTHEMETILDLGRKNELKINAAIIDLIFTGVDVLKEQLSAIRNYTLAPTGEACPQPDIRAIMASLRKASRGELRPAGDDRAQADAERARLGEILVETGAAAEGDVERALTQQAGEEPRRKLGEILVEQGTTSTNQVDQALVKQSTGQAAVDSSIRVDTRKLDFLVDAVGELVIAQSMVSLAEAVIGDEKLHRNVTQVTKIVRDVQETAMAMRMVPVGHTFQKMRRLVRDVSRKSNKQVDLTITGEETELDKNVIQQISDPLVHMVRNAVDHGIESPEARRAAGKPETGQVWLNAFHQGDSIVIEIKDDGKGLDRDKLIAKGVERGLIAPGDALSDQQAFALILQAGFSTAEQITDISGRGVGMDVVKRNIEQLRGKIEIFSEKGKGSTFQIRLPLTLAIIDGMLVRVGGERMIIPTILIEQSLRPEPNQLTSVQRRGQMLQVRGELCPMIQLGSLFGYCGAIDPCEHLVVIVQCEGQKIALVVEELIGQQQVVIKTLGERFKRVQGVSGAAILGDGRVGIILEPTGILGLHKQQGCEAFSAEAAAARLAQAAEIPEFEFEPDVAEETVDAAVQAGPQIEDTETPSESGPACPGQPATTTV